MNLKFHPDSFKFVSPRMTEKQIMRAWKRYLKNPKIVFIFGKGALTLSKPAEDKMNERCGGRRKGRRKGK